MTKKRRAKITKINDSVTLIDDAGEATCYVVEGRDGAMLIDSANGLENLREIVSEITDKPITLVNTHGHCDHINGNIYFDSAYMHPDDFELYNEHSHFDDIQKIAKKQGLKFCPIEPLSVGQVFDMGELPLEVVSMSGHTKGSIGILDRKHRLLFSGDGANTHIWMQLDESQPIETLISELKSLMEKHGDEFDYILTGHGSGLEDKQEVIDLITAAEDFVNGNREGDSPYGGFIPNSKFHHYGTREGCGIVYNGDKY